MFAQGSVLIGLASVIIMLMCMILTKTNMDKIGGLVETIRLQDGGVRIIKYSNSMEPLKGSWIGDHWTAFNLMSLLSALIIGAISLASPLSRGLFADDKSMWVLMLIVSSMFGFHFIWSSCIDWRFRKIPKLPIALSMLIIYAAAIICVATSPYFKAYLYPVIIIPIIMFLLGLIPGSGPSDGRLYAMVSAGSIPFMSGQIVWPLLITGLMAIVSAIIITVSGKVDQSDTEIPIMKRIMKSSSPMGPFVMVVFVIWLMLTLWGIAPSNSILVVM